MPSICATAKSRWKPRLTELREGCNQTSNQPKVTAEDIAEVVAMWTGVPVSRIAGEERERLLEMEKHPASTHYRPG